MDREWPRVKEIFLEAASLDGSRRREYLDSVCGTDSAVRAAVEDLLEHDGDPTDILPDVQDESEEWIFTPGDWVADRFEIIADLGSGGMGEVYKARDRLLGKLVALKTLKPRLLHHPQRTQDFIREIRNGQEVSHPNICRIHDLVWADADRRKLCFTMELIEGENLACFLRRKKRYVSTAEALPLIRQMAAGLEALHTHDIVHRDFKPGNVMLAKTLEGGPVVKVSDFGLARSSFPQGPPHTWPGSVRGIEGTPRYMAPEQFSTSGEKIGPASDIYAFGTVIYEMVTGQVPYEYTDLFELATQKQQQPPPPPSKYVPNLDKRWEQAILRCLEREPEDRPATALQVVEALESRQPVPGSDAKPAPAPAPGPNRKKLAAAFAAVLVILLALFGYVFRKEPVEQVAGGRLHVVVLPITPVGETPELQATADGLTEIITLRLSEHRLSEGELSVEPAGEVRRRSVDEVSEALSEFDSNYAVESTLQVEGEEVELALSLINTQDESKLTSEVVRGSAEDVFAIQDRAVTTLARMLDALPIPGGSRPAAAPRAYLAYVKGIGFLGRYDVEGNLDRAVAAFEEALSYDPDSAAAYAGLAEAYLLQAREDRQPEKLERAMENAERAVELDDMLAYAHVTLGVICQRTGDTERAIRELREALKLNPLDGNAHRELARVYLAQGRIEDAEAEFEKVEPKDWQLYQARGGFYFRTQRYEEAARDFEAAARENPSGNRAFWSLGGVYILMGRYAEAADELQKALAIRKDARTYSNLGVSLYYQGLFADAVEAHRRAVGMGGVRYVAWGNLGDALHWCSETREAAEAYEKAITMAEKTLAVNESDKLAWVRLASYQAKLNRCDDARGSLSRVVDYDGTDTSVHSRSALTHELCGERDRALASLERALGGGHLLAEIENDPWFAELRRSDRYQEMARSQLRLERSEGEVVQ